MRDNVCNMKELGCIEIHKSESGRYYLHLIVYGDVARDCLIPEGMWSDYYLTKEDYQTLKSTLRQIVLKRIMRGNIAD